MYISAYNAPLVLIQGHEEQGRSAAYFVGVNRDALPGIAAEVEALLKLQAVIPQDISA